jgi:hydroxylamine reductase
MMEAKMFCYQCQETMKGTGCILKGVCGKESHTAKAMDLLMFVVRGISVVTDEFRNAGHSVAAGSEPFCCGCLILYHYKCQFR